MLIFFFNLYLLNELKFWRKKYPFRICVSSYYTILTKTRFLDRQDQLCNGALRDLIFVFATTFLTSKNVFTKLSRTIGFQILSLGAFCCILYS